MRFKTQEVQFRYHDLNPQLRKIVEDLDLKAKTDYGLDLMITATVSTLAEDKKLGRLSDTHRTRRAVDIRTDGIPEEVVKELIAFAVKRYGKHGAIVGATPSLIVNKPHGTGPHLHVQLARKFSLPEIDYKALKKGK